MQRSTLDRAALEHRLTQPAVALALDLAGARPDAAAWQTFVLRVLNAAGIGALGAGVIFFVAWAALTLPFGTAACIVAIFAADWYSHAAVSRQDLGTIVAFAVTCAVVPWQTVRRRSDVFPMALICAAWIAISTAFLIKIMKLNDLGGFERGLRARGDPSQPAGGLAASCGRSRSRAAPAPGKSDRPPVLGLGDRERG